VRCHRVPLSVVKWPRLSLEQVGSRRRPLFSRRGRPSSSRLHRCASRRRARGNPADPGDATSLNVCADTPSDFDSSPGLRPARRSSIASRRNSGVGGTGTRHDGHDPLAAGTAEPVRVRDTGSAPSGLTLDGEMCQTRENQPAGRDGGHDQRFDLVGWRRAPSQQRCPGPRLLLPPVASAAVVASFPRVAR